VDITSEFEDHIASVNQTLLDIKANDKPVIMVLIKSMLTTIDEDDLMTEKTKHYTLKVGSYLDGSWGGKCTGNK
jgi:GTP-binding protein HflX